MLKLIAKRAGRPAADTLTLPYELRQKSRQRVRLDSGAEAALLLAPGTTLDAGDTLVSTDGTAVRVLAALEAVTTARTDDALLLARACFHLGNRHVRLQVGSGWVRYQPDHVLDDMVSGLGLTVDHGSDRFDPERGAYGSRAPDGSAAAHGASRHGHRH